MNRKLIPMAVAGALAAAATFAAHAEDRVYRVESDDAHRIQQAPDWNVAAVDGMCRLHVWVDDRARVKLRGDEITVETDSGKRSFDQGSVCTQPLPAHAVDDFHVVVEHGRGTVMEVRAPRDRNDYTGAVTVVDPQDGGDSYDLVMAWRNPGTVVGSTVPPDVVVGNTPPPNATVIADNATFDEVRACQDRVRARFLDRNARPDAYIDFESAPEREYIGSPTRSRIRGEAWAHDRHEARLIDYRCTVDHSDQRILSADYHVVPRPRVSSIE
ncbi:MAG TPA: hypothetical protein VLY46_01270 [Usitatibacter sp.]|nr:hypothetical protein [Usitatibacter sp.]